MCHCSKPQGVGCDAPDKQGDNCLQPASELYQQVLFSLKATFGGLVWKFSLDISFGCFGLMLAGKMCLNWIQRDLLLSLTTLCSILSVVILTFWELVLGPYFKYFWSGVRSENSIGLPSYRLITFVF